MIQALQKLKNKKGFTLVELIVVLVILAILAALLVPALTGYIAKANAEKVVAETRMVVMAAQTEASACYGKGPLNDGKTEGSVENLPKEASILKLAEVKSLGTIDDKGAVSGATSFYTLHLNTAGEVLDVTYDNGTYICQYKNGAYTVAKTADNTALKKTTIDIANKVTDESLKNPIG